MRSNPWSAIVPALLILRRALRILALLAGFIFANAPSPITSAKTPLTAVESSETDFKKPTLVSLTVKSVDKVDEQSKDIL
jgi:hypothetical protein